MLFKLPPRKPKRKGIKPRSAKGKGRRFEKDVAEDVINAFDELEEGDVMASDPSNPGTDTRLSPLARKLFPYYTECKDHKSLKVPAWIRQVETGASDSDLEPVVIFKQYRNKKKYAIITLEHLLWLRKELINGN